MADEGHRLMGGKRIPSNRLVIITGGPGSGKTTLVDNLHSAGFDVSPEAGRAIVDDRLKIGSDALPWVNPALFDELVLTWGMRSYAEALARGGTVFFDHAIPCTAGFIKARQQPVPEHFDAAATKFRYEPLVFVAPPWRAIYQRDDARWESFEQAECIHDAIVEAYQGYGYHCLQLPRSDVRTRLRFVLDRLSDG